MKKQHKISEEYLSEFVRTDFEKLGYETYAEVIDLKTTKRADLFLINKTTNESIIIESKLSFNLSVIQQAYHWVKNKRAHYVYVLIPRITKTQKTRRFARLICENFGIGVIEFNISNNSYNITVNPVFIEKPKKPTLYKEQKLTKASNKYNKYITPFKITVMRIDEYMKDKQYTTIINLVENIEHHYRSKNSACNSIKNNILNGVIKGYRITKYKNRNVIEKI